MSDPAIETFARLSRPQKVLDAVSRPIVPTKLSLQAKTIAERKNFDRAPLLSAATASVALPSTISTTITTSHNATDESQFRDSLPESEKGSLITLGVLTQDKVDWEIRVQRGRAWHMVKRVKHEVGLREKAVLEHLNHQNIAGLVHTFYDDGCLSLALEYCRNTLSEILCVHLKLEELQVQYIAHSLFEALKYLGQQGISHHDVKPSSIRITSDLRVKLSNFEHATRQTGHFDNHLDLIDLGFVLLECMDGHLLAPEKRQSHFIKEERSANRVFGLSTAEKWSGSKQLIDFLDDLFNQDRTTMAKFTRPIRIAKAR